MEKSLKFFVTFCKSTFQYEFVKDISELFFHEILQEECNEYEIIISDPKNLGFENIYLSNIVEVEINLNYSSSESPGNLISKIVQEWCNKEKNDVSNLWLNFTNSSILENSGKLCHSDVVVKEIAFGTSPDMQHFMQHYHYESISDEKEIISTFLHSQRKCMIYSCLNHHETCRQKYLIHNKFQFSYSSIFRVVVNYVPDYDLVQIYFHMQHIPFLFLGTNKENGREKNANVAILACDQEYQERNWNRVLDFGCDCTKSFCSIEKIGRCPVFKIVLHKKHKTHDIIVRLIQRCPKSTVFYFGNVETVCSKVNLKDFEQFPFKYELLLKYDRNMKEDIIFKCQFAWETLLSRSLEVRDQILLKHEFDPSVQHWSNLRNKLIYLFNINIDALVYTLYDVSEMITKGFLFSFEEALNALFSYHCKNKPIQDVPDGMCLVRRIIISPSRIICLQPSEHFDNRVIREYGPENLLRVSIQDDDFSKLTFAVQHTYRKREFMQRVVRTFLLEGIEIHPRKYELLASSNSQLREHGLWMFAKDHKGNSAQSIRKWMGDFHHIKNVAKYMARMGQCFSTSDEAVQIKLNDNEVVQLHDIKTKDGQYTFSDGVGMISKDLAREVREAFAKRNDLMQGSKYLYDPSAFQIRFKGCKGMVTEDNSTYLNGRKIGIRPSMEKFTCNSSSVLEVVKISAPRAVFLNRPLITILENLGVEESVFLDLQKKMVFDLTDSLIYERKARKMLENNTSLDFPFKKLSNAGISMAQEPFFRSLLLSVYKSMIEKLKCKARIAIPPKYGRNMMGVVDETKTLRYGEIFAQYSERVGNIKSKTKILEGTVIVTKNPCMHPGDVRKLKAVDVPALHHIKDCVVFPARGKRPHPDEMAGSDLDGDEYVLIWEPRLIFQRHNYFAMNYPPNEEINVDEIIQVEDMVDFFCQYIQADNIGTMANALLALADSNPEGIFSDVCMSIAKKYPKALDFAKSGTTCTLEPKERPKCYPDFMEKGCRNNSYKSQRTLGLLYRVIRSLEASVSNIEHKLSIEPNPQLEVDGWRQFENLAKKRSHEYSDRVKNILRKYGLQNEAEMLTGCISKINEYNSSKYDSENAIALSKKYLIHTINRYRSKFFNDCYKYANSNTDEKILKMMMASAWYMVTYQNPGEVCLSFPWVVSGTLLEIKNQSNKEENILVSESVLIDTSDKILKSLNTSLKDRVRTNNCQCILILYQMMEEWMIASSFILTAAAEGVFCRHCLQRIIGRFQSSKMVCCSFDGDCCSCKEHCSPMKLILECLKYYASRVFQGLGSCGETLERNIICQGFRETNFQSLALKTYAAVAITQNLHYLRHTSSSVQFDSNEEGDPIRIPVTAEFEQILTGNVDKVCEILQALSGVKNVHIDGSSERRGYYILVQSIGPAFQRWNLEELIMDQNCPSIIRNRLG